MEIANTYLVNKYHGITPSEADSVITSASAYHSSGPKGLAYYTVVETKKFVALLKFVDSSTIVLGLFKNHTPVSLVIIRLYDTQAVHHFNEVF